MGILLANLSLVCCEDVMRPKDAKGQREDLSTLAICIYLGGGALDFIGLIGGVVFGILALVGSIYLHPALCFGLSGTILFLDVVVNAFVMKCLKSNDTGQ